MYSGTEPDCLKLLRSPVGFPILSFFRIREPDFQIHNPWRNCHENLSLQPNRRRKPADLGLYFSLYRLPPKPPDFRLEPVGRVVSPPFRQSRHTGRQVGLQVVLVFLYRFAVQPFEAALGIGQSTLCYETVENSDHI